MIVSAASGGKVKGAAIPWELAELFRRQAEKNHSQTLERLAARGGLSPFEAACALVGCGLFDGIKPDEATARAMLAGAAHALDRMRERAR